MFADSADQRKRTTRKRSLSKTTTKHNGIYAVSNNNTNICIYMYVHISNTLHTYIKTLYLHAYNIAFSESPHNVPILALSKPPISIQRLTVYMNGYISFTLHAYVKTPTPYIYAYNTAFSTQCYVPACIQTSTKHDGIHTVSITKYMHTYTCMYTYPICFMHTLHT